MIMLNKLLNIFHLFAHIAGNIFFSKKIKIFFITENANWIIRNICLQISEELFKQYGISSAIKTTAIGLHKKVIHFGSINTFHNKANDLLLHRSNKTVLSVFHILTNDKRLDYLAENQKKINIFHTACQKTKKKLISAGISEQKITVIPLGIDLSIFKAVAGEEKKQLRVKFNIPLDKIVIGSFQKDGTGWGEGLQPKLEKGPDIFIKVVEQISKTAPIFVLLTGPSRGYVKRNLEKLGIPYKHMGYLEELSMVAKYYRLLDFYLITSRIEGGPAAILESWASGIPVVSTNVGMVQDIAKDNVNILLNNDFSINDLANKSVKLINDDNLRKEIIANGLLEVQKYDWKNITRQYYEKIYAKMI